ncbi:MAG: hypothetical protein JWN63_1665, partial [Candidatus Acidoferrum typicum]|nr:hypothetical protein [Candidatus Acidoferrum typicum]
CLVRAHARAFAARQNPDGNVVRWGLSHVAIIPFEHRRKATVDPIYLSGRSFHLAGLLDALLLPRFTRRDDTKVTFPRTAGSGDDEPSGAPKVRK